MRSHFVRRALAFFLPVAVPATLCCGLVYAADQQNLRSGANAPQIQMAQDAASALDAHLTLPGDALAVAGGAGAPSHLWDSEALRSIVKSLHAAGKPVGAICLSPPVLARAGILAGRRATAFPADRALLELKRGGATYVEEAVVLDGTIVTASGPEAAAAFGQTLAGLLTP